MKIFAEILLLLFGVAVMWWLSGWDARATGENRKGDFARRCARCLATLFFAVPFFGIVPSSAAFIPLILICPVSIALLWCGPIAEMCSHGFHHLTDPQSGGEFDRGKTIRDLNTIALLIREGRRGEAIQLCESLKESGDASVLAMETILEQLGVSQKSGRAIKPLNAAAQLRDAGQFQEAEMVLNSLLVKDPSDVEAAMLLMRIYAEDLRRGDRARQILESLKKQRFVSAAHIEFAERSIYEWLNPKRRKEEKLPDSFEELLEQRYFGTAMEMLEQKIEAQPENFEWRMKLAEVQGRHCNNFAGAEKIIRQMESDGIFSREQIQTAKMRLKEWRALLPQN